MTREFVKYSFQVSVFCLSSLAKYQKQLQHNQMSKSLFFKQLHNSKTKTSRDYKKFCKSIKTNLICDQLKAQQ